MRQTIIHLNKRILELEKQINDRSNQNVQLNDKIKHLQTLNTSLSQEMQSLQDNLTSFALRSNNTIDELRSYILKYQKSYTHRRDKHSIILHNTIKQHKQQYNSSHSKKYSSCNPQNTKLLTFGYIHQNSFIFIPIDIIQLIYTFYDPFNITWTIKDTEMNIFLQCKHKDTLIGPNIEPIPYLIFELSLCPNGWRSDHKGHVAAYICCRRIPKTLKNIFIQYTLLCKEMEITHTRTLSLKTFHSKGYGWDPKCVLFDRIVKQKEKCIHIECNIDIISATYEQPFLMNNYISVVPQIKDIFYKWDFNHTMMNSVRKSKQYRRFWSDSFGNKCWVLSCLPYKFDKPLQGKFRVFLMLLRLPCDIDRIKPYIEVTAYCDGTIFRESVHREFDLDFQYIWKMQLFDSSMLDSLSTLSITIWICNRIIISNDKQICP